MPTPTVTIRVRVPFVDVDSSGRIHFTALFRYMEVAEHELMRAIGLPYATALRDTAFPRVHLSADFRAAATYDMLLDVEARVERVGTTSWTLVFTTRRAPEDDGVPGAPPGALIAEGHMTIVAMDPATERPVPLPDSLRRALGGEGGVTHGA
ncbi:MAG TPA: thioesterase family protein [Ktedonobacterales bacterium]|nr:thioesterase family protein [Ktedonobacterales bacterium]